MADLFSLRARKRNGFIALELCIVTVLVFTLAATVMLPRAWQNDRHKLDVLVDELALDLNAVRQYAIGNHLGEIDIWSIVVQDGEYRIMHNYRIEKSTYFGNNRIVTESKERKDFSFDEAGRPSGPDMRITFKLADDTYKKTIVIAAQTGRIRIEKA